MKRFVLFSITIIISQFLFAQNIGIGLKGFIQNGGKKSSDIFPERYSYRNFNDITYLSAIVRVDKNFNEKDLIRINCKIGSRFGNIFTLYIPVFRVNDVLKIKGILDIETSRKIDGAELNKATNDVSADLVWQGYELPQGYSGKNVIIGVTDWGFDYTHPMFYDTLLNNYRILAAWDQYRNQGPAPSGYLYGTVFEGKQALLAAECDTLNIYKHGTHGTHVSGIASGGGATTQYRGVAFDAELLMASFLIDESAVLDAYAWMRDVAQREGKRLVINGSWGLYHFGMMDGTSLLDQAIINLSENDNVVFVTSGGNNGTEQFHIKAQFANNDTITTGIGFDFDDPNEYYWGETITMAGDSTDRFSARLEFYDNQFQLIKATPWVNTYYNDFINDTCISVDGDSIIYRANSVASTPLSNRPIQEWEVRLSNYQLNKYFVVLSTTAPTGIVHAWNVACLSTGVGNWGLNFKKYKPTYILGNNQYGVGEPAVGDGTIAVAAYSSNVRGSSIGGSRASFSSIGPTIDGRIKPEVAAPGVNVTSSISSYSTDDYSSNNLVSFEGRDYPFAAFSGTSMSSPMVTGIVALMLEANPNLTPARIKEILKETARQDYYTTTTIPNYSWGWGKVSTLNAVKKAVELIGLGEEIEKEYGINIYPNPMRDNLNIVSKDKIKSIEIYDIMGRKIMIKGSNTDLLDVSGMEKGVYVVVINLENKALRYKVVKK